MTTRLCRDCRHSTYQWAISVGIYNPKWDGPREDMSCRHGMSGTMSVVTGVRTHEPCTVMRAGGGQCGQSGKLWEAPYA